MSATRTDSDREPNSSTATSARSRYETSLVGHLETWPLSELLLWLNKTGRTAMVRVGVGLDAGLIFADAGTVIRCEWGALRGEEALWALLDVQQGFFTVLQRDLPNLSPNVAASTEQLLLQHAVARDHRARGACA